MTQTRDGELWLGLPFQGLARFDVSTGEIELFGHDPENDKTLSHDFPYVVLEGPEGELWVGTHRGLNRFDRSTTEVRRFFAEPGNASTLSNSSIRTGLLDGQDRLWFGTELGLNRYDPVTDTFQRYFNGENPGHNVIHKILEDDDGTFWIGMDGGLARFDPQTGEFQNVTHVDGVPAGFEPDLNWGPDSALYALAPAGVVRIDPAKLLLSSPEPVLAWTGLSTTDKDAGTQHLLRPPEALSLTHRNELVTLGFTALDYSNPEAVGFRYRLAGFTEGWVPVEAGARRLTLSPLPPGDYRLELQALGANGAASASELRLPINYRPPPWRSPWAYLAYGLLGLAAVWFFVQWRTRLLRVRASDLAAAVDDRTKRLKQSEQTVRLQSDELRELLDTKERLFANVSHEFRTPLTLMLGPIEHARAATENIEIQRQLDMARRNGNRVLRLVDQLLALSRLAAEEPAERTPNPIADVIETVTDAFRPLSNEQGISLTMALDRNLWSELPPEALERILMNLLSNALKFTREGGHVAVEVGAVGAEQWRLKVTDTGSGIASDELDRVFERFERARGEGRGVPGSGIGLALVKELVEAYDGQITLDSEVGEGTAVTVTLPRHIPREGLTIKRDGAPSDALVREVELLRHAENGEFSDEVEGVDRPQVLVVEDNADMRAYIQQILSADHQVLLAHDGDEGLAMAREQVPDLVLSDVMMPGLSGIELAGELRKDMSTSHIPIVLLTARSDDASRLEGLREQVDDYLVKPFNAEELRLRVTNLLAIREILRARYGSELSAGKDPRKTLSAPERKFMERLSGVLEAHHGQQGFGVHEFAAEMAMSERQLQRKLKAVTGQSPGQYLRLFRLERALPLLRDGMAVGEVALTVGFTSPAHFSSCFRAQYGCTPTEYEQDSGRLAK
jgi:signal transduction histidine kinase/CheY-like chemotaxis protein/AraC-like DNA-binding protein